MKIKKHRIKNKTIKKLRHVLRQDVEEDLQKLID